MCYMPFNISTFIYLLSFVASDLTIGIQTSVDPSSLPSLPVPRFLSNNISNKGLEITIIALPINSKLIYTGCFEGIYAMDILQIANQVYKFDKVMAYPACSTGLKIIYCCSHCQSTSSWHSFCHHATCAGTPQFGDISQMTDKQDWKYCHGL